MRHPRIHLLRATLPLLVIALAIAGAPARQTHAQNFPKRLGAALVEASQYKSITVNPTPLTRTLPPAVDLSASMPPVGDQGSQDSCVAWSTAYAARTYLERMELKGQWNVAIPAAQFSPAFLYNQIARGNCSSGITVVSALNLLIAEGAATLTMMPYTDQSCAGQPSLQVAQMAAQFKISGYRTINTQDLNAIKAHLAAQMPIIVAMNIDNAFMGLGPNQNWTTSGPVTGSHAMVVVGYNDAQHAFKLINSWGTGWGTGGYGYVDYSLFPSVAKEAYVILPFYSATQPSQGLEANVQLLSLVIVGGTTPGLNAQIEYTLRGYAGHTGLIVLYFWYTNGQPVGATIPGLADIAGNAAIATGTFAIQNNDYENFTLTQFIPTADLNVPVGPYVMSGGQLVHEQLITPLLVKAELFVDNYGMAQSQYFTFSVAR
ncbi:MAG TPA: C1 family peptidase [Candidatus Acidoferrales bacterium]|jgi:hypothetical protein|nr:C1 family peptidase [Candidatus Acidoferrales bacterium]